MVGEASKSLKLRIDRHGSSAMGMSKCYSLMKCLLLFFNIVFLAVGAAACALAGWALWAGAAEPPAGVEGAGADGAEARAARAGLAAWGAWGGSLAGGAALGLAGAARQAPALLAGSFSLLALCGVAEGAAAWWGAQHGPELRRMLQQRLRHALQHEYGRRPASTHLLDAIQQGLECCGVDSPRDWQQSAWARAQGTPGGPGAPGDPGSLGAPGALAAAAPLDLTVGAPPLHYEVPLSCCPQEAERCPEGGGGGGGGGAAGCGARVRAALAAAARGPLLGGAALLAAHALLLLLTLALCLRAPAPRPHKA